MKRISYVCLLVLFLSIHGFAQGMFTILNQPHSPASAASGWTGVTGNTDQPLSFYYNPAKLGVSSQKQVLKGFTTFSPIEYNPDETTQMKGFQYQQDFSDLTNLPLTAGIGYTRGKFLARVAFIDYEITDEFNSFSLGAALDYKVKIGFGLSIKDVSRSRTQIDTFGKTVVDLGLYIEAPIHELLFPDYTFGGKELNDLRPLVSFAAGYSMMNLSGKAEYDFVENHQYYEVETPLARTSRLGYSVDIGLRFDIKDKPFDLFKYSFIVEAEDNLAGFGIERYNGYIGYGYTKEDYEKGLGHFKPVKNFINLEGDTQITLHKAHNITLLETFTYMYGSQNNTYSMMLLSSSSGYIFSSDGMFKLLSSRMDNKAASWILDHVSLSYYVFNIEDNSFSFSHQEKSVGADGISIGFKNFISL